MVWGKEREGEIGAEREKTWVGGGRRERGREGESDRQRQTEEYIMCL